MNRRHRAFHAQNEVDSEGSWAVSYGDMVTLLLTFFIVFFTADKFQMQKNLKLDLMARQTQMSRDLASVMKAGLYPDQDVREAVHGQVYHAGEKVIVEFSGVSFFPSGQVVLTPAARRALDKFYSYYAPYMGQFDVDIRAFTDTRKVRWEKHRPYKDNLELSALRSVSVMRHLQKAGVPLQNMKLGGYGELHLSENDMKKIDKDQRHPAAALAYARTAVLVIEPKEEP